MNITFVARRNHPNDYERWKIFQFENKEDNPFYTVAEPGEKISGNDIVNFISYPPIGILRRKLRHFILDATLDGYSDIRYYYS